MTPRLLRLALTVEFLVAVVAVFTAWSEIGGQAALDLMYWAWKLGLALSLAGAIVGFTAATVAEDKPWTVRSARWLVMVLILIGGIAVVTYYYVQAEPTVPEDNGAISMTLPASSQPYA